MEDPPSILLLLPQLVCEATAIDDIPLGEQVELSENSDACQLARRRCRDILQEGIHFHLHRDAPYVIEGDQAWWDCLRVKGKDVKRLAVMRVNDIGSTFESVFALCPDVTYVFWTCEIPLNTSLGLDSCSPLQHLRRLDWKFSGNFKNTVEAFIKVVQHSPVLEHIDATEAAGAPLHGWEHLDFSIPDSVTTLGFFCHDMKEIPTRFCSDPTVYRLLRWIRHSWSKGSQSALKHVITSGPFPPLGFQTFELHPNPNSTSEFSKFDDLIQDCLPKYCSKKGTLIYSCTAHTRPERLDLISPREWVEKVILKTSGSIYQTEDEELDAVRGHLDFVLKMFPCLMSVDLCDDFQTWKEDDLGREMLVAFENSAQERDIAVEYITLEVQNI